LQTTAKEEVDEKSKVLADVEVVPALSPVDVVKLERHQHIMLKM